MNNKIKCISVLILIIYVILKKYSTTSINEIKGQHCLNDKLFDFTFNLYSILKCNVYLRKFIHILSSGILDVSIIILSYSWIIYGKNWRPIMSISLFFIFREICNYLFQIKPDEDILWDYSGFPSLTISYHNNKDFFFCGSIGLYLICILELVEFKYCKLKWVTIIGIFIHFWLLISLRAQYYFSILCGLLTAHYVHIISNRYNYLLNEIHDFNPEETTRINTIKAEAKIKNIIEMSIKKFRSNNNIKYDKLPVDNDIIDREKIKDQEEISVDIELELDKDNKSSI